MGFRYYSIVKRKKTIKVSTEDINNEDNVKKDSNTEQSETESKLGQNKISHMALRRTQTTMEEIIRDDMPQSKNPAAPRKKNNVCRDGIDHKMGRFSCWWARC